MIDTKISTEDYFKAKCEALAEENTRLRDEVAHHRAMIAVMSKRIDDANQPKDPSKLESVA